MHNPKIRIAIALIAAAGLAFSTACSDDDVSEGTNQEELDDVGHGDDADTGDDADADDDEEDVVDEPDADVDDGPDVEEVDCAFPSDDPECEGGDFGPATFFTEFVIETRDEEDACCFDLCQDVGGSMEGFIDNRIGEQIVGPLSGVDGIEDINHNINASIQSGDLMYLLESAFWNHPEWDNDLELRMYRGSSTVETMERNLAGEGSFNIGADNFDDDGEPLYGFGQARVNDGVLTAEDGFISVEFPGLVDGVQVLLGNVKITGDIVQDPEPDLTAGGKFALENGKLGGVLLRDRLFKSINVLSHDCPCLDVDVEDPDNPDLYQEGLFRYRETADDWRCTAKEGVADQCQGSGDPSYCQVLGHNQLCTLLGMYSSNYDCEVDGEVGFSIGVHFESVTTEILGIDPE